MVALGPADDRAGLIAAIFTVSYLATGIPVLVAGITTSRFGLHDTALVYAAAVTVLAAAAACTFLPGTSSRAGKPQPAAVAPDPPPGPCTVPPYAPAAHEETEPAKAPRW